MVHGKQIRTAAALRSCGRDMKARASCRSWKSRMLQPKLELWRTNLFCRIVLQFRYLKELRENFIYLYTTSPWLDLPRVRFFDPHNLVAIEQT